MKTYLITGGAGFIGSHLSDKLMAQGHRIVNIDNFDGFYDPKIKENNIKNLQKDKNYILQKGDIREIPFLGKVFASHKIDVIIHIAAMAGVRPSIENPLLYQQVNIQGTFNILEMARKNSIKSLIFASSSSVYGNTKKLPFNESMNVDFPISPYAMTKKAGELLCHTYHHLYKMNIVCLRFFTVYGPRQRPDLAIHKFVKKIHAKEPIPFFGDGTTQRDYTYIDDIVQGIKNSIRYLANKESIYEIFNLGESRTISLKQMVVTIEKITSKTAILEKLPMQAGDVNKTYADISKAKKLLNYNPNTQFEEGIRKFVTWYLKK